MEQNKVNEKFKEFQKEIENLKEEVKNLNSIIDVNCVLWDLKLDFFEEKIKDDKKIQDNLYDYLHQVSIYLNNTENKLNNL